MVKLMHLKWEIDLSFLELAAYCEASFCMSRYSLRLLYTHAKAIIFRN